MKTINLRKHYLKTIFWTNIILVIILIAFYLIFSNFFLESYRPFKFYINNYYNYRFLLNTFYGFTAALFYIGNKYLKSWLFYKNLHCPFCGNQYHNAKAGVEVRLDYINTFPCEHCKHQYNFEL